MCGAMLLDKFSDYIAFVKFVFKNRIWVAAYNRLKLISSWLIFVRRFFFNLSAENCQS